MDKVLLVNMPFSSANRPAIGITLLKGALRQKGVHCDIRYLQFQFARLIGYDLYYQIAQFAPRSLVGEWIFAHHLFGQQIPDADEYFVRILSQFPDIGDNDLISRLPEVRKQTSRYLDFCMEAVEWEEYDLVGFGSTFAQNTASLALAKRVKAAWSEKVIVFGGANCEGEMGTELHRQFPFVDYVCSGESDWLFPELVKRLKICADISDLKGLVYRESGETKASGSCAEPVREMDLLPLPDYDDYFEQLEESGLAIPVEELHLLVETARGCWWGEKSQCIFCGLNNQSIQFRSKSSQRALDEFAYLIEKYPDIKFVDATDKIMNMGYFQKVIPELYQREHKTNIFYFTKANLNKDQLRQLRRAGIRRIQPGIESLDTSVLQIMRKGCTSMQNIQLLKNAGEVGLEVIWNFISGFPGEDETAYQRMVDMIPAISHLQPPSGDVNHVRLDRYSPYFRDPEENGMKNVRPAAAYRYVYPFDEESLSRLAYYFDFDYADGRHPESYTGALDQAIKDWHDQADQGSLLMLSGDERLRLYDTRVGARQREYDLEGTGKWIYEYCDVGRTLSSIQRYLEGQEHEVEDGEVEAILKFLVDERLMLHADDRYLSLAISMDEPIQEFVDGLFSIVSE